MPAIPASPTRALRATTLRFLFPPFAIAAALLSASTLVLMAATIDVVPFPAAVQPPVTSATVARATPTFSDANVTSVDVSVWPLVRADHLVLPTAPCGIELARLTYRPTRGGTSQTPPGPWLLVVESGELSVRLGGSGTLWSGDVPPQVVQGDFALQAGDGLGLPMTATVDVHNNGTTPVVALAAGVFANVARTSAPGKVESTLWDGAWSPGATVQPLGGGWLTPPPTGPTTMTLQRLSLQPQDQMPWASLGAAILSVEIGTLTLLGNQGLMWQQAPDGPADWIDPASPATLLPGESVLLQDQPEVTLRNDGSAPLLALLLTVFATDDDTS